jgi:ParB family chromosome partitioning protein
VGKQRKVLGRGLDALIPGHAHSSRDAQLDDIVPGHSQPRTIFDETSIEELAASIRIHGVIQPLLVTPPDSSGKRRLIAGERRWQAARLAGLGSVPIVERETEDRESMEIALVENLQREDLSPLEEAAAFERLIRDHGLTQEAVATRVGRSRPSVANSLRLLSAPTAVKLALADGRISEGHARALLMLRTPDDIEEALARITRDSLSVRQTEQLVASKKSGPAPTTSHPAKPALIEGLETDLRRRFGTKVSVVKGRRIGRIVIEFYSDEELAAVTEKLLGNA